jgi:Domain of unknown function (DUF4124)
MVKIVFSILIVLIFPWNAIAHSGGTNAEGCHKNRKTGDTHCHNKKLKSPKSKNPTPASKEKNSNSHNKQRIFQWVDQKGEIHYSNNIEDVPASVRESSQKSMSHK